MSATFVMLATTVCADGLPIKQSTNASSASLATGVNAGCFEPPYIFGGDGASAPEVLGQDPAEYACFSPRLSFPPVGSLSPELERADLVGPATCFGPPDPAGGYPQKPALQRPSPWPDILPRPRTLVRRPDWTTPCASLSAVGT